MINSYAGLDSECMDILSLASKQKEYLPNGDKYIELWGMIFTHGVDIFECVANQAELGDRNAERILVKYFDNYYSSIKEKGIYEDPDLFLPTKNLYGEEAFNLFLKLALNEIPPKPISHTFPKVINLHLYGQAAVIKRIKSIEGKSIEENAELKEKLDKFRNRDKSVPEDFVIEKVFEWKTVYLPVINKAIKEKTIEFNTGS